MKLLRDYNHTPEPCRGAVMALGNFDGCHLGHQAVLKQAKRMAESEKAPFAVLTFEPHPRQFFTPSAGPIRLSPLHIKAQLLKELGVDILFALRFNEAFSQLSAEVFMQQVLDQQCGARHVITGGDFVFGHQRSGTSDDLERYAGESGAFDYSWVSPVGDGHHIYSSTQIRHFLQAGEMHKAAELLGRPYEIIGRVIHGDKRGRGIGFPTANLRPGPICLPRRGVYAVTAQLWQDNPRLFSPPDAWQGVANLGYRPTFGGSYLSLEVHIKGLDRNLYGKRLRVALKHFIREEMTFADGKALKKQIEKDCEAAWEWLSR